MMTFRLTLAFVLVYGIGFEANASLFEAAREAVRVGRLDAEQIVGLDTAEKLAQAMQVDSSPEGSPPQLKGLLEEIFEKIPSAPEHLKTIPEHLSWRTYALAVQDIINWKSPQDACYDHQCGYIEVHWEDKDEQVSLFEGRAYQFLNNIRFGFIPLPNGEIGKTTILLCLAHRFAIFGLPTSFSDILIEEVTSQLHTAYFIRHDAFHNSGIYGPKVKTTRGPKEGDDLKNQWVLSGRLQRFLGEISMTNEAVSYLFDQLWEGYEMHVGLVWAFRDSNRMGPKDFRFFPKVFKPSLEDSDDRVDPDYVKKHEAVFSLFPKLYMSLFSSAGPFSSEKELESAFQAFKNYMLSDRAFVTHWSNMPSIFEKKIKPEEIYALSCKKLGRDL